MFPVKAVLSAVCLVAGIAVLGGDWHWGRPIAAAILWMLGASPWYTLLAQRPRTLIVGALLVGVGAAFIYMAIDWNHSTVLPVDCSQEWRQRGCALMNMLHAIGGPRLIRFLFAVAGLGGVIVGVQLLRGRAKLLQG